MHKRKQQILIFDGMDSCGKTNIALKLSNILRVPYFKNHKEKQYFKDSSAFSDAFKYDQPYIAQFLEQTGYSVIFDRGHPSEYVYASVYNRKTDYDLIGEIDHRFARMNAKIIIPYRSDYSNVSDDLIEKDKFDMIHQKYVEFSKFTRCKAMFLNVDDENLDREIKEIKEFLSASH